MVEEKKLSGTNETRMAFLNAKTVEMAAEQEENLISDYDEALREWQEKNVPYKVRFKGRIFDVPRSIPFSFSLFYMRNCIQKVDGKTLFIIPDDKIAEFIERMFGEEFLSILNQSDDVELAFVVQTLVPDIMDKWGYNVKKAKVPKNK